MMSEVSPTPESVVGLLAEFDGPQSLKRAAVVMRDAGFSRWDTHSPFPIHGMDRAMGIRPTVLPWLVLGAGITGAAVALLLQWWTNAIDYPFIISGKPLFSLPANIPITFELIVLFSGLTAFGGALGLSRLPQFSHPVFRPERFGRATSDGFFLSIDAADAKFDESATRTLLESAGATAVDVCRESDAPSRLPKVTKWVVMVLVALALLPPIAVAYYRSVPKSSPRIHLVQDMDFQPKYLAQEFSPLFEDRRSTRPPVEGTVAEGQLHDNDHLYRGKVDGEWAQTFPMPVTRAMMRRGQERFAVYCAPCHGLLGDGRGMVAIRATERMDLAWKTPVSLHSGSVREQPVGQIFNTLSNGIIKEGQHTMPSYSAQISVEDRWAIVLYELALQRSQDATADDVPEEVREKLQ